jgi:hypothetical protein
METSYDPIRGQKSVETIDPPVVFDPVRGRTLFRGLVISTDLESLQDSLGKTTYTHLKNNYSKLILFPFRG